MDTNDRSMAQGSSERGQAHQEEGMDNEGTPQVQTQTNETVSNDNVQLRLTDRVLLLGESLSGKTYLADKALRQFPRVVIITTDPREFDWCPNKVVTIDPEVVMATIQKALDAGNCMIVIDDCDITLTRYTDDPRLRQMLAAGRHRGCGWFLMSRRTQDIPTLAFKQANKLFIFQTDLPHDREMYVAFYGPDMDQLVVNLNRANHECLYVDREARTKSVIVA